MQFNPLNNLRHFLQTLGYIQAYLHQFFLRVGNLHAIAAQNQQQRCHADALVAIYKAMVLHQTTANRRGFVYDRRVCLHPTKAA